MFSLNCQLFIGSLELDFVHEVTIESSWQKFTDTATITLPRKIKILSGQQLPDVIQVGDVVVIRYGYNGEYRTEFTGVVSALKSGSPFTVSCEDFMWYFKRKAVSYSWRSITLTELLTYLQHEYLEYFPPRGFEFKVLGEVNLGKYLINQATAAQVFDDLKKRFLLNFFFREGVLYANKPYEEQAERHRYGFTQNVIESDLTFVKANDQSIIFRGASTQPDGKKVAFDYNPRTDVVHINAPKERRHKGDAVPTPAVTAATGKASGNGQIRTLLVPPGLNGKELEKAVRAAAAQICFDGYRGEGLLSFGLPIANHGDIADLHDPDYPERSGAYYIDAVTKTFGINGSRRKIKLGPKAPPET
ncbi:hypothetical protein IC235_17455 [Hymenobacter sp. BT664]|uniref:Uncharacterized protein n=1 Tax=Hymenobacter montanus TaxID=2771359 RepID=A0A927BG79_9BACT|nr:hypothetical protein [Hymenobacter montanus]MBD2769680.1 hypothetical protein [Hymenobacter montanus]